MTSRLWKSKSGLAGWAAALQVLLLTMALSPSSEAAMVRKSLNQLALESALFAAGTVADLRYETAGGHART